jgi:uncharacterized zinc-type alcohol dehydrogenase-like protein
MSSVSTTQMIEGFAAKTQKARLEPFSFEPPPLGDFDVELRISHCGICHSDLHLINNDWKNSVYPLVPGHEIIGTITKKGKNVTGLELGQRAGVGWQRSSCGICEWCQKAEENLCFSQQATCLGHLGGFSKFLRIDYRFAFSIPDKISSEKAAPLLCAGATVFSPLLNFHVNATWRVGILGVGGLGHLAIQFARALGCEVWAFSSTSSKEEEAKGYGATHFISSKDTKDIQKAANSLDLLLYTASEMADFPLYVQTLRPKGILCLLGAPQNGSLNLPIFQLIEGSKVICGSNIGSPHRIRQMLACAARHGISPKIELFPMKDVNRALEKLSKNQVHYRAVLYNEV